MTPIIYRDFTIQPSEGLRGKIEYFQEGEVTRFADSVTEAKREIDEEIRSQAYWSIKSPSGAVYGYSDLKDALLILKRHKQAVPLFTFNAP
jgi:hypothetical protein